LPTIHVVTTPGRIEGPLPPVAVVIDVLRATTMMAALLDAGARGIRPAAGVDEARAARTREPEALLAGERGGIALDGFDMGNSPSRIVPDEVRGRVVILTTTNGTQAIERVRGAERCLTLSLTNLDAVAARLRAISSDTLVVCSGTDGGRSDEDELAAGMLADRLRGWDRTDDADDAMDRATGAIGASGGIEAALRRSFHARRLIELGFEDDVRLCAHTSTTSTVPTLDRASGLIVPG
jgi:2-phosphosulfolactate phosphatase